MIPKYLQFAGLLVLTTGAQAQEWTEQSVLNLFDQQSPIRREAQAATAAAVEAVRGRTLWPNPVASYSRETSGFTEFIQAEQQLPLSGRLRFERRALEPAREAGEAQGAARLWDARSSLRVAFYRALAAQQQADAIRAGLADIAAVIELLGVREREGEGSRFDRIRIEREAADLRADLALALARASGEQAVLASYLPMQTAIANLRGDLRPRMIPASRDEVIRQALEARAEIRAESRRLTQLSFEAQAAGRLRFPEPVITAGMKRTQVLGNVNDTGAVVGISIPLPVFMFMFTLGE